jgi:hypothetical protein
LFELYLTENSFDQNILKFGQIIGKKLQKLVIEFESHSNQENIQEIALKWKKFNDLYIDLFSSDYQLIFGNIFDIIELFHNLKTVEFKLPKRVFIATKRASVQSFKGCK